MESAVQMTSEELCDMGNSTEVIPRAWGSMGMQILNAVVYQSNFNDTVTKNCSSFPEPTE